MSVISGHVLPTDSLIVDDESSNHSPLVLTHDEIYNTLCKLNLPKAPVPGKRIFRFPRQTSYFHTKYSSYGDKYIPSIWNYANVT